MNLRLISVLLLLLLSACSIRAVALVETGDAVNGKTSIQKEQNETKSDSGSILPSL